jgi:hypothetical protein
MIPITPNKIKELKKQNIFKFLDEYFKNPERFTDNFYHLARIKIKEEFSISEQESIDYRDSYFAEGTKEKYFLDNLTSLKITAEKYVVYINKILSKNPDKTEEVLSLEFEKLLSKVIESEKNNNTEDYFMRLFTYRFCHEYFEK